MIEPRSLDLGRKVWGMQWKPFSLVMEQAVDTEVEMVLELAVAEVMEDMVPVTALHNSRRIKVSSR